MSPSTRSIFFRDDTTAETMLFAGPHELVVARKADEILLAFALLQEARKEGKWLAGFIAYEAGYIFEPKLAPLIENDRETPLLCFGIFDGPTDAAHPLAQPRKRDESEPFLTDPRVGWDFET